MADVGSAAPAADDATLSLRDAAGLMAEPEEQTNTGEAPAAGGEATPEDVSAQEADAGTADDQPPTGETEDETDAADTEPPIDPPKSWTKAEKDAFKTLPHDTQQSIVERERARESHVNRQLSEIAEQRKAAEAQRAAAEQVRQQYEAALPNLLNVLQQQVAGEFGDVKTWDDVNRMQAEDPLRFQRWQLRTQQVQQLTDEAQKSQARQQQDQSARFQNYREQETRKFLEAAPEFADPKTAPKLQAEVQALLSDVGITQDELKSLWSGQQGISIHDHRVQLLIRDAAKWRAARNGIRTAKPRPATPVQKPGVATNRGEVQSANIQKLHENLSRTGSRNAALEIMNATSARR